MNERHQTWMELGRTLRASPRERLNADSQSRAGRAFYTDIELTLTAIEDERESWCDFRAEDTTGNGYFVRQYRHEPFLPEDDHFPTGLRSRVNLPFAEARRTGAYFLIWRRIDATTVQELVENAPSPLPLDRLIIILTPVMRLMEALHEFGFACGCLQPNRVMIAPSLETSLHMVESPLQLGHPLAPWGEAPGSIHPRAFSAFPGIHDMDSEVYSLASFAWQLLANRIPPASAATNYRHAVALRGFRPDLPPGIAPLIEAGLSTRPTVHYATPRAFIEALSDAVRNVQRLRPHSVRGLAVTAETHIGIQKRHVMPINQDAILAAAAGGDMALLLVSDGVSTADFGSGDIASEFIRSEAFRAWRQIDDADLETTAQRVSWLQQILDRANRGIVDYINDQFAPFTGDPSRVMAATAVIGLVSFGRLTLVSTGDSPAFLVRDGKIERLNRDMNVLTMSLVAGADVDSVLQSGWPEALAACVGSFVIDESGYLRPTRVEADALELTLAPDDRLVLCSDGLTDYIADNPAAGAEIIRRIVAYDTPAALAALELILLGNRGGGGDNISVALCYVSDEESPMIVAVEDIEEIRRMPTGN